MSGCDTPDVLIYPRLVKLAQCVCQQIADSGLPGVCFCGVMPGAQVAHDYMLGCEDEDANGMAWVRLVVAFPYTQFPVPLLSWSFCSNNQLGFSVEVGILRNLPTPDESGEPATVEQLMAATELQLADMAAMRRAILCCYPTITDENDPVTEDDSNVEMLGQYTPFGPTGLAVGGTWTVALPANS